MSQLKCVKCSETQAVPMHCGQEMHVESVDGKEMLVCWMGTGCGKQDFPVHCDESMEFSE
ncbi:MAG: hypothetical protein ACXAEU_08475 [Candidatus Hodarchaeales archaeon]|jgi:hypothetical protein